MAKRKTNTTGKKTSIPQAPTDVPVEEGPVISEDSVRNAKYLSEQLKKSEDILKNINDLDSIGIENYADKLQLSQKLQDTSEQIATVMSIIDDYSKKGVQNGDFLIQNYTDQVSLLDSLRTKLAESVVNSNNIVKDSYEMVDISDELEEYARQRNDLELIRDDLSEIDYNRQTKLLDLVKERLDAIEGINKSQETANKLATDYLKSNTLMGLSTNNLIDSLDSFREKVGTGKLGVIGEFLGKKAGDLIEKTREDIQSKITLAFQESGEAAGGAFGLARIALGSFMSYALPALGILGLLGIFGGLVALAGHLDQELSEIGKTLGISRKEAEEFHLTAKGIAKEMKLVGINSKEAGEAMMGLASITGGLSITSRLNEGSDATRQLVKDVAVLQNTFGLATDEAGGISSISEFAIIMGKSIGQVTKESMKLGKGLLTTKASISVIGKIAPSIAIAFKKGSVELLKAAQRAKLLGLELEDVADFGDKILDFESSLESEMTARVITGKNINFDMARQYALAGDIAGLQEEMLTQLGSMKEFQSMNRLQQKYMAEAFGMTVDEVAKLLTAQERLVELGIDQTRMDEIQNMNAAQLADEMKNVSNEKLKGYLQTLAKEKESAAINERISDAMTKIKEKIAGTLAPLLEMAHEFLNSAEGGEFLQTVVKGIESTMKAIVPIVKFLAENIWILAAGVGAFAGVKLIKGASTIMGLFKGIGGAAAAAKPAVDSFSGAFGDLATQMGQTATAGNAVGQSMGGAQGAASGISGFTSTLSSSVANMAVVAIALVAFAGALYITAKAFQEFSKVDFGGVVAGTIAMGGLLLMTKVLTAFATAAVTSGAILAIYAIAVALVALGASVYLMGKGAEAFSNSLMNMADAMKKFATITNITEIVSKIKEVVTSIANIGSSIDPNSTSKVKKALKNLGIDQLVEFGKLADMDLGKAGENVINAINSLASISIEKKFDFGRRARWASNGIKGFTKELGTGIIGAFEQLNKALGELELENLEALAKIAGTDMSKLGENITKAIESLAGISVEDQTIQNLEKTKGLFSTIRDVFEDYNVLGMTYSNLDSLEKLASFDVNKLKDASAKLKDVIYNFAQIGIMGGTEGLDLLADKFTKLSNALDQLNVDKLKDLSNINADNLAKISSVFQQPQSVNVGTTTETGGETTSTKVETEQTIMNKKLDQVISVLTNIFNATNQPTYINIGGKTVEAIGLQLKGMQNRTIGINANGAITNFP